MTSAVNTILEERELFTSARLTNRERLNMARRNPLVSLVGYILADKEDDRNANEDSETEEEEEEKQPEFLDMKEMDSVSSGGYMFKTSVPAKTEGDRKSVV